MSERIDVPLKGKIIHRKLGIDGSCSKDIRVEKFEHLVALCKLSCRDALPTVTAAMIVAEAHRGKTVLICTPKKPTKQEVKA